MQKRTDIQVLRAIAILSVIMFHLERSWLPGGFLGVDIFFVISGFLITQLLIRRRNNFILSRVKRLLPGLTLMLLVTLIVGIICLPPIAFEGLTTHAPWAAFQVSNFSFMRQPDYFGPAVDQNPLLHTWSLGIEEQFYLFWALAVAGICRFRREHATLRILIPALILSALVAEYATSHLINKEIAFFSPVSRIWEFGLGGLAGVMTSRKLTWVTLSGFTIMILSLLYVDPISASNPLVRAIPCLGVVLILMFPVGVNFTSLYFLKPPLTYIGDISYSLYLWHWPVICLAPFLTGTHNHLINQPTAILLILLTAIPCYHFCERSLHRSSSWKSLNDIRTYIVVGVLTIVFSSSLGLRSHSRSGWRFDLTTKPTDYTFPTKFTELPEPPFAELNQATVALIGDSHARHFAPVVSAWVKANQMDMATFWGSEFFAVGLNSSVEKLNEDGKLLASHNDSDTAIQLQQSLLTNSNLEVVFIALRTAFYLHDSPPFDQQTFFRSQLTRKNSRLSSLELYQEELRTYVNSLTDKGIRVVLLGQAPPLRRIPKPGASLLDQILNRSWIETDIHLTPEEALRLNTEEERYAGLAKNSALVFHLNTRQSITETINHAGVFLYQDDNHINYAGSMHLFPTMETLLK